MNVEELLDQLDEVIDKGLGLGSRRCIVDAEKIRILIDDIRLNMPQEIKQARSIVSDRADIITTAKREAEGIIHQAEEKAKTLVAQEEITRQAQARAADIIAQSQQKSREMRKAAQELVDDIMRRADEGLTMNLSEVRKVRASLKQQIPPAGRSE